MLDHLNKKSIFLASKSPRRKELFETLNLPFKIISSNVSEDYPKQLDVMKIAEYLAKKKADIFDVSADEIYITADTTVIVNNQILNKPFNSNEAFEMLSLLSNNHHIVNSGVCIKTNVNSIVFTESTEVTFKSLSAEEINHYISNHNPYDKAGGYGIQDWIGKIGVNKIKGCYYNVMGLPLPTLYKYLLKL